MLWFLIKTEEKIVASAWRFFAIKNIIGLVLLREAYICGAASRTN